MEVGDQVVDLRRIATETDIPAIERGDSQTKVVQEAVLNVATTHLMTMVAALTKAPGKCLQNHGHLKIR
jgi:hypothetical protein